MTANKSMSGNKYSGISSESLLTQCSEILKDFGFRYTLELQNLNEIALGK